MKSGLYIVTLNNEVPISVNAQDSRIADKTIKVTKANCKFGKARNLESREKNYHKTFGKDNVKFIPIAKLAEIQKLEKTILGALDNYRIRGRSGRKNEWLQGIKPEEVLKIALFHIEQSGVNHELLI